KHTYRTHPHTYSAHTHHTKLYSNTLTAPTHHTHSYSHTYTNQTQPIRHTHTHTYTHIHTTIHTPTLPHTHTTHIGLCKIVVDYSLTMQADNLMTITHTHTSMWPLAHPRVSGHKTMRVQRKERDEDSKRGRRMER